MAVGGRPSSPTPVPAPIVLRRFSVHEYQRMAEAGILTDEDHVELLEGWITPKMIHNPPHDLAVGLTEEAIRVRLTGEWKIRIQSAITTEDSKPEPDVAIVKGPLRRYANRQPEAGDIALIVEVADTSVVRDRYKCQLYARAEVPVYWIVNVDERQVEVYTQPTGLPDEPHYARQDVCKPGDSVPLQLSGQPPSSILVDDLLP